MTEEEYSKACEFLLAQSAAIRIYVDLLKATGRTLEEIRSATDSLWDEWHKVKEQADAHREKIGVFAGLDELTRLTEEMGLYDD